MKVLYVEDNPLDIDLTLRKIKKDSPEIIIDTAKSQTDALTIIRSEKFKEYDLVLTDMHLQDGDGIAILSHIRGHSLPVAVVILTGQGDEEAAVAALKVGADDYIVKKRGYLNNLASLLEKALVSYRQAKDVSLQPLRVLYVEHNQADIDLTRRHLDRYAPHIQLDMLHRVSDFYDIVDKPGNLAHYSAILLDYRLPQENALEILKRIKLSANSKIPVILITGKGDEEIAVKALKIGAFDYVTKNQGYLFKLPSVIENAYYSMRLEREHEALTESEKRYRTLFENNHVVMLLIDPDDGRIIDANSAAIQFYGWSYEQLLARQMSEINIMPAEDQQKARATVKEKLQKFIFTHRRADNSLCDVEVFSGPMEVGGRTLLYSMVYDITERIALEREREVLLRKLVQAQKMEAFGQLAGGIAHDFNNILSAVIGFTELALAQVDKNAPIEEDLQEIYTAGKRAKDLVLQILAFARQSDEQIEPVDISAIAKEVLKLIRSSTSTTIEIRQNFDSCAMIRGNSIQIHQIMMNLCSNAIYAMDDDGGILEICLNDMVLESSAENDGASLAPGNYVKMTVSDTGTGIPQDILDSIFEPYFTTKPLGEGTGMGLSMVQGIVQHYGGRIAVDSTAGKGTVVTIYLPIAEERSACMLYKTQDLPQGTERILLVDDEAPIVKVEKQILGRLGYKVTAVTDSVEALKIFTQQPDNFDLVMSDINMPNLAGDKLARKLLEIRPDIPIILCTGYSKKVTEETVKEIGVKAFAYKPIVAELLATTIRRVLEEESQARLN